MQINNLDCNTLKRNIYVSNNTKYFLTKSDGSTLEENYAVTASRPAFRTDVDYYVKVYSTGSFFAQYVIVYDLDERTDIPFISNKNVLVCCWA